MRRYKLADDDSLTPVRFLGTLEEWAEWLGANRERCTVAFATVPGGLRVSTRFVGYDLKTFGPAEVWQTVLLRDAQNRSEKIDDVEWRYVSRQNAETGHRAICERLGAGVAPGGTPRPFRAINIRGGDIE